jgi:hypothetical protein
MRKIIEAELGKTFTPKLVTELLDAHEAAKKCFYLGGLRLAEVEGGRFCEAAFRLLEEVSFGAHTTLGTQLDSDKLIDRLRNLATSAQPDAIRLHIPRALRLVYDIRNKRDAAHLADGIDPNLQDATLVVSVLDWVLAEFLRLYHSVSANEAKALVDDIVSRTAPIVQDFSGALKVLSPELGASDHCLVLLYQRGEKGASFEQLRGWVRPTMRANLKRTLTILADERDLAHFDGSNFFITRLGQMDVEKRRLIEAS